MTARLLLLLLAMLIGAETFAHEVRPAHLRVTETAPEQYLVQWKVPALSGRRLAIDPIFHTSCEAVGDSAEAFVGGAAVRSWSIDCAQSIAGSDIGFANLSATMVDVLVQISFLDGREYSGLVRPSDPIFVVPTRDSEVSVFYNYLRFGVEHILSGWDHLLFVLGLVLLVTNARRLFWAITGFTLGHSVTLALGVFELVRIPAPPIEAVIALSIVLLAVEVLKYRASGTETMAIRAPWAVSIAIGLIHGLGFAGALSEFGLPAYARFVALLSFNVGVEIGQLLFIAVLALAGYALVRIHSRAGSVARLAAAWCVGVSGAYWFVERLVGFIA